MTRAVECPCGERADVPDDLAGGWTNCPRCGKAVAVPGDGDVLWRVLRGLALVVVVLATAWTWDLAGPGPAVAVGVALALLAWALSRAL